MTPDPEPDPTELGTRLACHVLDLVRAQGLHVGQTTIQRPDGSKLWHLDARANSGETWPAETVDFYRAAVLLAELVGVDLRDG